GPERKRGTRADDCEVGEQPWDGCRGRRGRDGVATVTPASARLQAGPRFLLRRADGRLGHTEILIRLTHARPRAVYPRFAPASLSGNVPQLDCRPPAKVFSRPYSCQTPIKKS